MIDRGAEKRAAEKWNAVAKPLYGLGKLEESVIRIAGIQGSEDIALERRAILVFCADNGIVAQGVTQTGSHVTALVADNIAEGKASVNRMCSRCGRRIDVFAVDMGIRDAVHSPHMIRRRIADGTRDFSVEPAMSGMQAQKAVETGIGLVREYRGM